MILLINLIHDKFYTELTKSCHSREGGNLKYYKPRVLIFHKSLLKINLWIPASAGMTAKK
jgi:hypothetical protein